MQPEIFEQRKLVDEAVSLIERIRDLNDKIEDIEFKTDIFCVMLQHRHQFEEQGVTDHSNCLCMYLVTGTIDGVMGGLVEMATDYPEGKKLILKAASIIKKQ